jgi:hypothetical protein
LLIDKYLSFFYSAAYSSLPFLLSSSLYYLVSDGVSVAVVIPEGKEDEEEGGT